MAALLIVVTIQYFHLYEVKEAYQESIEEDREIILHDEELIDEYRTEIEEIKRELEDDDADIARLARQKAALVKEIRFFDYTYHTVDLMLVHTLIEPDDPGIQSLANTMTEEGLYNFVKNDIVYNSRTGSNQKASEVLEKAEGNCVEKAVLMASLLRAKGHPPETVLVGMGAINFYGFEGEPPENHAWVEFHHNGKWLVLDTTSYLGDFTFARWERQHYYTENGIEEYFVYNDKGSHIIEDTE